MKLSDMRAMKIESLARIIHRLNKLCGMERNTLIYVDHTLSVVECTSIERTPTNLAWRMLTIMPHSAGLPDLRDYVRGSTIWSQHVRAWLDINTTSQ